MTATPTITSTPTETATPSAGPSTTAQPSATGTAAPTVTGTPGSGGGGGEEPQDVMICESLPGGMRELRIKGSEWPMYQGRAPRGPCPISGSPAVVQSLPPAFVADTAGTLPAGPPPTARDGAAPAPLRLEQAGRVRLTLLGARTSWCDGDVLLLAPAISPTPIPGTADGTLPPGARRLWSGSLRHVGESVEVGPYPAGTTLVLGYVPRGVCAAGGDGPRPSGSAFARVAPAAPGVWNVWWEDFRTDGTADFDDLVVRVEVIP